jgi:F0F1-type ATP synthase membrane subunit b/b'
MVVVTNSPRIWLVGMLASLAIFAVVYFTVIQPSTNTANQAIKTGLNQSQQALNQAQQQLNSATGQAKSASGQAKSVSGQASAAAGQAQQQLSKAAKLTSCVSAAGTDVVKVQACQAQFSH